MKKSNTDIIIITIFIIVLVAISYYIYSLYNVNNLAKENIHVYDSQNVNIYNQIPQTLGEFSTRISQGDDNRTKNIITCANYLNNHIVKANEEFSFNELLGPYVESQGYLESTGFSSDGHIIPIVGGGICQVSSTLYNVLLIANFEITERHEHSLPVDYVEKGKDATIVFDTCDLKFINNKNFDIIINTAIDDSTLTIRISKNTTR